MKKQNNNSVRIIGGRWRGRRLAFPDGEGLRPTHDRIRETVFNWLMHTVIDSHCLDLFAGSGALGFEALSRGAKSVTFIDSNPAVVQQIQSHIGQLSANATVLAGSYNRVSIADQVIDIVFLDPPFSFSDYQGLLVWLHEQTWLSPDAVVYLEMAKQPIPLVLSENWVCSRHKSTSTIDYYLLEHKAI
jgi:16S rRNA (guanine966-N2)-methyltransferase